jgi:hypothetical protein
VGDCAWDVDILSGRPQRSALLLKWFGKENCFVRKIGVAIKSLQRQNVNGHSLNDNRKGTHFQPDNVSQMTIFAQLTFVSQMTFVQVHATQEFFPRP